MADYYKELGLEKGASTADIKKAYRRLAKQYHPDRNPDDKNAEARFKKISEAYAVLSDPNKRKQYDTYGASGFSSRYSTEDIFRGTDFGSIFNEFDLGGADNIFSKIFGGEFGGGGGGFRAGFGGAGSPFGGARGGGFGGSMKGQDIEYPLQIGFHEAFAGGERQISFQLSDGSQHTFRVKIPAGVKDGGKLRIAGKGAPSPTGGAQGDLLVKISVAPHPDFHRSGNDIEAPLPLKISEALLGTTKEVNTMDGTKVVKIPPGVKPGTKIRLKSLGFPNPASKGTRGDFFCVVEYKLPQALSDQQKEIVEQLQALDL